MSRRLLVLAAAVALTGTVALALRTAGDQVRRPEGAAERYLQALSNDHDATPWGDPGLASPLVDFEPDDDTLFATIEVGRASLDADTATVPARIVRNDAAGTEIPLALTARRDEGGDPRGWRIVAVEQVPTASVPSEGGLRPARADAVLWPVFGLAAVGLAVLADVTVTRLRRRQHRNPPEPAVAEIGYEELAAKMAAGTIVLVDAQAPGWFEREHLPGARPIDWHAIAASAARIIPSPDSEVAVYCWNTACTGSEIIADELTQLGYQRVRRYVGGKQDWADHGAPLDQAPAPTSTST